MTETKSPSANFPIGIGETFGAGWDGYKSNFVAITLAGATTWVVLLAVQFIGSGIEDPWASFFAQLAGVVFASAVALPWYRASLAGADGKGSSFSIGSDDRSRIVVLIGASIYFWAGLLLGLRYLNGIPALVVLVFYAFYGFVIADSDRGVVMSLSYSVYLGQGRRIGIFAIGAMLALVNFLAFLPFGSGESPAMKALTVGLLVITTSFSMVCGAVLYRALIASQEEEV